MPRSISKTPKELSLDKRLHSIIEDRTSGAAVIEGGILGLFEKIIRIHKKHSPRHLRRAIVKIKKRFSAMANIMNLVIFTEKILEKKDVEYLSEAIKGYKENIEHERGLTVTRAARKIKSYDLIFTLSGSSLILKAIIEAGNLGWRGGVKIAESRPKNEGTILASDLARLGIPVTLGVDANMPDLIKNSNAIFLGADAVTQTYFVNKTGSGIALEFGSKYSKPVFIIADRSKFISNRTYRFIPDSNPPNEIISRKTRNLEILNNYFEKIAPRKKFRYICGNEIINPDEVKNLLKRGS
ncbi:MAG: hypothetical protein JSU85_01080 [Candidatus Zixiibacteriota bacterium]|nr:MAG: hypothetical protein JSU85_01080 [candidate division Zixibacteria bacterium]